MTLWHLWRGEAASLGQELVLAQLNRVIQPSQALALQPLPAWSLSTHLSLRESLFSLLSISHWEMGIFTSTFDGINYSSFSTYHSGSPDHSKMLIAANTLVVLCKHSKNKFYRYWKN